MKRNIIFLLCIAAVFGLILVLSRKADQMPQPVSVSEIRDTNSLVTNNNVLKSPAVEQTPASVSAPGTPESEPTTEAEANAKVRRMLEARNKPIQLWGKVVDQDDAPLSDVKVEAEINHFVWPPDQYPNGVSAKQEIMTDADGRFHISDNSATGIHVMLQKAGYEQESRNGYGSSGQNGNQEDPAILRMWNTNIHEQLITGNKSFDIVPDGRPYFINLTDGTISETADGDLKVWIQYTNQIIRGNLYDWSAGIEVINGGLLEVPQEIISGGFLAEPPFAMYSAPADDYIPSFSLKSQIKGGQRGAIGNRYFYLLLHNGKEYGRMSINLFAPYGHLHPGLIRISYAINPSGSRVLR